MKKAINALLIVDIGIVIFCLLSGQKTWLINTQIGFITSTLVMFGSILSYRSMVQGRLNAGAIPDDNRDTIDKLEDPYDLYSEEQQRDDEDKTLKELVKEERKNLKKNRRSVWQTTKDSKASLSFYRLGAYALLIMGFFYLNSNQLLDIPSYLFSLIIPPVILVIMLMRNK
ncbi:hypothetical protein KKC13_04675 [bacterium]|nr:hypothetical protein [bacterium]MBU1958521.1 hypothetical protein [bacterium]